MTQKNIFIMAGVALAGWFLYDEWRKAEAMKLLGEPSGYQNNQYAPAWSTPQMGIGIDGKPALIYMA